MVCSPSVHSAGYIPDSKAASPRAIESNPGEALIAASEANLNDEADQRTDKG
jgi:hypothetical protein